jgi:hypothetical protein
LRELVRFGQLRVELGIRFFERAFGVELGSGLLRR